MDRTAARPKFSITTTEGSSVLVEPYYFQSPCLLPTAHTFKPPAGVMEAIQHAEKLEGA